MLKQDTPATELQLITEALIGPTILIEELSEMHRQGIISADFYIHRIIYDMAPIINDPLLKNLRKSYGKS